MNDFTYDELMTVLMALCITDKTKPIHRKIAEMLDGYCEHDWRKGIHLVNDVYCTNCKLHFEVNNEREGS